MMKEKARYVEKKREMMRKREKEMMMKGVGRMVGHLGVLEEGVSVVDAAACSVGRNPFC